MEVEKWEGTLNPPASHNMTAFEELWGLCGQKLVRKGKWNETIKTRRQIIPGLEKLVRT